MLSNSQDRRKETGLFLYKKGNNEEKITEKKKTKGIKNVTLTVGTTRKYLVEIKESFFFSNSFFPFFSISNFFLENSKMFVLFFFFRLDKQKQKQTNEM